MHNLKPKTSYQIVTIRLAIQAENDAEATDGLNEMLRRSMTDAPDFIGDYMFEPEIIERHTDEREPEEGDLFPIGDMKPLELIDIIDGLDGAGLIVTDPEGVRNELAEMGYSPTQRIYRD